MQRLKSKLELARLFSFLTAWLILSPIIFFGALAGAEQCGTNPKATETLTAEEARTALSTQGLAGLLPLGINKRVFAFQKMPGIFFEMQLDAPAKGGDEYSIELVVPIKNLSQGKEFLALLDLGLSPEQLSRFSDFLMLSNGLSITSHVLAGQRISSDRPRWLRISQKNADPLSTLSRSLTRLGLTEVRSEDVLYDFSSNSGRHSWALRNFRFEFAEGERSALKELGTQARTLIQQDLREGRPSKSATMIDAAIAKNSLDRAVRVYVYETRAEYVELWQKLNLNLEKPGGLVQEPAYILASLDPHVPKVQRSMDKAGGVYLEIEIPKGSPAAYLEPFMENSNSGYLELVLARGSQLKALAATRDAEGDPLLRLILRR